MNEEEIGSLSEKIQSNDNKDDSKPQKYNGEKDKQKGGSLLVYISISLYYLYIH